MTKDDRVFCKHPDPDAQGVRIERAKYDAMRTALLAVLPDRDSDGTPFKGLRDRVEPLLPDDIYAGASVSWYLTTVKLDLEARGLIERVPNARPQRLRRRKKA